MAGHDAAGSRAHRSYFMRFMSIVTSPQPADGADARLDGGDGQALRPRNQGRPHDRHGRADADRSRARVSTIADGKLQRHRRSVRGGQGSDRRLRHLRIARQGRGARHDQGVHAAPSSTTCRAGKAPARCARSTPALPANAASEPVEAAAHFRDGQPPPSLEGSKCDLCISSRRLIRRRRRPN